MLALRPHFECRDKDLSPDAEDAHLYLRMYLLCGFCGRETQWHLSQLQRRLVKRLIRPAAMLKKYPPSIKRVLEPEDCAGV
jgi:uncharacterized protein